jgi:ADP-ribose pyrophosphatase YjhB (NUDIX family)
MYKVFIDNKVIIFTKTWKKSSKTLDFVMVQTAIPDRIDLVKCRNELPNDVILVVKAENPEKAIRAVFAGYDFVEAAGGIVKRKNNFLFIERHGLWDIPKGKMEKGEKPAETAVREIEEECGIQAPVIDRLIGVTFHT